MSGDRPPRLLRVGPLSALLDGGDLRYITFDGTEVLRRIYVAVRDDAWGTVPATIEAVDVDEFKYGFAIRVDARHEHGSIQFDWQARVLLEWYPAEAGDSVLVRYATKGQPRAAFATNRTGLCVLHPLRDCAGRPCQAATREERSSVSFPALVAPHQPFTDVLSLRYAPRPDLHVTFTLDTRFETEDQRNWGDASFKSYGRPLTLPYPYTLRPGETVSERVTLYLQASPRTPRALPLPDPDAPVALHIGETAGRLPALGYRIPDASIDLSTPILGRLASLRPSHLRVDLPAADPDPADRVRHAAQLAQAFDSTLEVAVHLPSEPTARLAVLAACPWPGSLARWLVYEQGTRMASPELLSRVRPHLQAIAAAPVGAGTIGNFAELNRARPPAGSCDLVAYPYCPQIHATATLSLFENLEAIPDQVATALSFAPAVSVGPIRFHRVPDPFAGGAAGQGSEAEHPDPRQHTDLGAAWTLGLLANLATSGAASATLYDLAGPFGVLDGDDLTPVGRVLALLGEWAGAEVLSTRPGDPLRLAALALRKAGRSTLFVANLTDVPLAFTCDHSLRRVALVDEPPVLPGPAPAPCLAPPQQEATSIPLAPYEVARFDVEAHPR